MIKKFSSLFTVTDTLSKSGRTVDKIGYSYEDDFDIFEEAVVDETGNFYKYDSGNGKKPPIWTRIGGKIYGLAIIWIVLSTKPWK